MPFASSKTTILMYAGRTIWNILLTAIVVQSNASKERGLFWRVSEYFWRRWQSNKVKHIADHFISRYGITICKRKVPYRHWDCCWELPVPTCLTFLGTQWLLYAPPYLKFGSSYFCPQSALVCFTWNTECIYISRDSQSNHWGLRSSGLLRCVCW